VCRNARHSPGFFLPFVRAVIRSGRRSGGGQGLVAPDGGFFLFEAIAVGFGVNCFFEIFFLYFKEKNFFVYSNMKG
jgi:hypothetical protein